MEREIVTADSLDFIMDFDRVIQVHENGTVSDVNALLAPTLAMEVDGDGQSIHANDEDIISQAAAAGWSLLSGFTGQHGYRGPIMHPSEFIGGVLANVILEKPGYYVSVVVECEHPENRQGETDNPLNPAGWAVAYREV